jgi:hypothetical protein
MNWSFLLPPVVLLLIIIVNILVKKKTLFQNLKSIIPHLFVIFILNLKNRYFMSLQKEFFLSIIVVKGDNADDEKMV